MPEDDFYRIILPITANMIMSAVGYFLALRLMKNIGPMFIKAHLFGRDMCKPPGKAEKVPESQGVVCGTVYLVVMFLFIPLPFLRQLTFRDPTETFPFHEYVEHLAALLSICCMIFLGFADDVLDLRWRHKLLLPTIASLPLLMVYLVTFDLTVVIVPSPLRFLLGYSINIGLLYYVYMGMLAVFCTNAINIVAGINGLEVGQGVVISCSVIVFNLIEIRGQFASAHVFSLYFMLPFAAVSLALMKLNWYPSRVFVGDTYCYFAGMTFAVVAILGHFSKTMLLFFIPQVLNFLYSTPQLFRFIPCPRHRMPRYSVDEDRLELSYSRFKSEELGYLGRVVVRVLSGVGLLSLRRWRESDGIEWVECNNMTILNLFLKLFGPMHEASLTTSILCFQVLCSIVALIIRYPLARLFYDS